MGRGRENNKNQNNKKKRTAKKGGTFPFAQPEFLRLSQECHSAEKCGKCRCTIPGVEGCDGKLREKHECVIIPDELGELLCAMVDAGEGTEYSGEHAAMLVDSGSGLHACPRWHAPHIPVTISSTVLAKSASGEKIEHYGRKKVPYELSDGSRANFTYVL